MKKIIKGGEPLLSYEKQAPPSDEKNIWLREDLYYNTVLREIFKTGYMKEGKTSIKLTSSISPIEGFHLHDLIVKNGFTRVLEVGMANAISTIYMLEGISKNGENGCVTSIDPFQSSQWNSRGVSNVNSSGLSKMHSLIEKPDYQALPGLLDEGHKFDLIFIDGMHLFDYTLLDVFYAVKLCHIGSVIVIDDIKHVGPQDVIKYIDKNYPFLKRLKDIPCDTVASYVVIGTDHRKWSFHKRF
jgi:predicted O-methyltransferase YrrM